MVKLVEVPLAFKVRYKEVLGRANLFPELYVVEQGVELLKHCILVVASADLELVLDVEDLARAQVLKDALVHPSFSAIKLIVLKVLHRVKVFNG